MPRGLAKCVVLAFQGCREVAPGSIRLAQPAERLKLSQLEAVFAEQYSQRAVFRIRGLLETNRLILGVA